MEKLLNITDRTNFILHALARIAAEGGNSPVSVKLIAEDLHISETYLAKILQPLVKEGLLVSLRGAKGGFSLAGTPEQLNVLDLLILLEGKIPENACLFPSPVCGKKHCAIKSLCVEMRDLLLFRLKNLTVADLAKGFTG